MTAKINRQLAKRDIAALLEAHVKTVPPQWQKWDYEDTHEFNKLCRFVLDRRGHTLPKLVACGKRLAKLLEIPESEVIPADVLGAV